MAIGLGVVGRSSGEPLPGSLIGEGLELMRERWAVYATLAAVCAFAGQLGTPNPRQFADSLAFRLVMICALVAIFFVLPSAVRRLDPMFTMTPRRTALMLATLIGLGLVTELGYLALILPGVALGVLLSQTLLGVLLSDAAEPRRPFFAILTDAVRRSYVLTRTHFATTFGVIVASLAIVVVPFVIALFALFVLEVVQPHSLVITAPVLLLVFVYFECVRYALIVRWYARIGGVRALIR